MLKMASTAAPAHQKLLSNWGISGIILQVLFHECNGIVHPILLK